MMEQNLKTTHHGAQKVDAKFKQEEKLGRQLNWSRSDETKGSFITISLDNVSIENETGWIQMSKFHAEWSKRFFDVLVSYLR